MIPEALLVIGVFIVIAICIYGVFAPAYVTCTKCGQLAIVDYTRGLWECPHCKYGKYLKCPF